MLVIDYDKNREYSQETFPAECVNSEALFVFCRTGEIETLRDIWDFDESTVLDCVNIDESVRFTAFDGYDFVSLVHMEMQSFGSIVFNEINLYISRGYFILVMPEHASKKLFAFEAKITAVAQSFLTNRNPSAEMVEYFDQLLFLFFNTLLSDFSDVLELLEDYIEDLSEKITLSVEQEYFDDIQCARKTAYSIKKTLRALSYMGLQVLCNENDIISKKKLFLFRNLDTRFRKIYDFAENVYGLSTELLNTYDSKVTQRTNDIVNKLTFITLFFGPLTVITGIYGMNFDIMPELKWPLGYPFAFALMAVTSLVLYIVLKKKKWL